MTPLFLAALALSAAVTGTPLLGTGESPAQSDASVAADLGESAAAGRWVEVTPLRWDSEPWVVRLEPGQSVIRSDGHELGPAMACGGGAGSAIRCERGVIEEGAELSVPPATGQAVIGRLIEGREAVIGARVAVLPSGLAARRPFTVPLTLDAGGASLIRSVTTDERGRFQIPPLASGEYRLEINLLGGRTEVSETFHVRDPTKEESANAPVSTGERPVDSPVLDLGDLTFDPGLAVEIWAWSADGGPLGGAKVGALQGERTAVRSFEGRTDGEGRAEVRGFEPDGTVDFSCTAPGYLRYEERFPEPPLRVDCRMVRLAAIAGSVTDPSGPLSGATVSLVDGADRPIAQVRAGEDGQFELSSLSGGEYRLIAAAPDYRWRAQAMELAAGEVRRLEPILLTPASRVEGLVRDAVSGTPVADATVEAVAPLGALSATTDAAGRFEAPLPEEGALVVLVYALGYARQEATLAADADLGDEPWTVDLDPGGRIRAVVWSEGGEGPCAGCTVVIERPGASAGFREGLQTSAEGVAETGLLAPDRYQVVLEEVQSLGSTVTVRSGDRLREAVVTNGRTTEVFFLPSGTVEVRFWPTPAAGWRLSARGSGARHAVDAAAPGVFQVPRERGEVLELSLIRPGLTVRQAQVPADFQSETLELSLPATAVHGRLRTAHGALPTDVEIHGIPPGAPPAARSALSGDGDFYVPFLAPGVYGLVAGGAWLATFEVSEGEVDLGTLEVEAVTRATAGVAE